MQLSASTGEVVWTSYVPPGAGLPDLSRYEARALAMELGVLPPAVSLYRDLGARRSAGLRRVWTSCA